MKYIFHIMSMCFEYICFMYNIVFVFLLQSHFWLIHFPPTHAFTNDMYVLSSYMCSITLGTAQICSSYSHMPGPGICCDSQTIPIVATGASKPMCCQLTLAFMLTSVNISLYITLLLYWLLYDYAADILTPTTVKQAVDNYSWGLYCRHCYCICVCWDVPVGYSLLL